MAKIILQAGDTVTHSTLGKGVVTIVDEEYVTIKFATDELTFRRPDAFRKGFLSSDDAKIIGDLNDDEDDYNDDDDEEEDEDEEDDEEEIEEMSDFKTELKTSGSPAAKKESPGCLLVAAALIAPLIVIGPVEYILWLLCSDGGDGFYLFLMILGIIFYALLVFILIKYVPEEESRSTHLARRPFSRKSSSPSIGPALFLGTLGFLASVLSDKPSRKKSRSIFDGLQDGLHWQRKHSSHRW